MPRSSYLSTQLPPPEQPPQEPPQGPPQEPSASSIADLLEGLPRALPPGPLRLRQLLDALGDRGLASVLLVLAIPQVLPTPLLLSNLLALPILVVAVQMLLGRHAPWLPAWALDRPLSREGLERGCARLVPLLRRVEGLIRPRWSFVWSRWNGHLLGAACLVIALVSVAPLPFTGWAPGWALLLIALGLLQRDGLLVLIGLALGVAAFGLFVAVIAGLVAVGEELAEAEAALPLLVFAAGTGRLRPDGRRGGRRRRDRRRGCAPRG